MHAVKLINTMAMFLMNAHNIISSCCGAGGNVFSKIFHNNNNNNHEDQHENHSSSSSPAAATFAGVAGGAKPFVGAKKFGFTDKQAKYEDVPWSKLPMDARKAAKVIGFEQKSWDDKEWLDIDDKHWHDMTTEEVKACEALGWDKESWEHKYEHTSWNDMPKHVQQAAEKLGWNKEKWDDDWDVAAWEKEWTDFTPEERRCLHVLGYYVHTWE